MTSQQYKLATSKLKTRLFIPYQRDGVEWMLGMENQSRGPKGGFLCDEMGLGKTVQLISTVLGNPKQSTLIIVPKSIITQWVEEINRFAPSLHVTVFDGPGRKLDLELLSSPEKCSVTIAPYSLLSAKSEIHRHRWNRVILDEAHEIRNGNSKIFKSVCLLKTEIKWIVTGTPVFNSMQDFVSLCTFLGLSKRFVQGRTRDVKDVYILRRTKEDLSKVNERLTLPPCTFENVELDMFDEEKALYEFVFMQAQTIIRDAFRETINPAAKNMVILECLLRARQCMIWPQMYLNGVAKKNETDPTVWTGRSNKMETLLRMIDEHPDEKTLIFCQFKGEMNYIQSQLSCPVFRIDGTVPKDARVGQIHSFKKFPKGAVFIIQIKCGGQGLNLQEATRVYITAPAWNPATELQAIGRSHRMGQNRSVYVKKFVYKECTEFVSVEQEMMALQGHKSLVCSEVLNDERIKTQIPVNRTTDKITILDIKNIFRA